MFLLRRSSEQDGETISEAEEYKQRAEHERRKLILIERFTEEVEDECTQDVDEMAPPVWIRLIKSSSPEDVYEDLCSEEKAVVEKWKSKRGAMLQTRIQNEVKAKLEDEPSLDRDSTPFIRLLVRSYDRSFLGARNRPAAVAKSSDVAVLTVWTPTEEQLSLLREGIVVKAKNLSTGKRKYEGRIQLSASQRTLMAPLPSTELSPQILTMSGFTERHYASIFQLHVSSRQLLASSHASTPDCDCLGVILKVAEDEACGGTAIYLADKSNLVVRVQCGRNMKGLGDFIGLRSPIARQCVEHPCIIAIRDVIVLPFDKVENCAVVEFRALSSLRSESVEPTTAGLRRWAKSEAGQQHLLRLAAYWDAGLSIFQRSQAVLTPAVGYIAGFTVQSSNQLHITVDTGTKHLQKWAFPFHLLHDVKLPNSSCETVALSATEEGISSQLNVLGKFYRARGILFRFTLKRDPQKTTSFRPTEFEVCQIKQADIETVAGVYAIQLKSKPRL